MKQFKIEISETLQKAVTFDGEREKESLIIVEQLYRAG